ncbi:MAG: sigma-70 family RNA polymerase sigma factor [Verrucomicrobiales bacterium]|nr:sigma-70 family RNA polymerase sigma factor [Verrucomicrobiales bacterium]
MALDSRRWKTTRASLLVRIQNPDDADSWREFVDVYAAVAFAVARHSLPSDEDAQDVVQEVFSKVCRTIGEFRYDRSRGTFKAWLFRMVRNCVVDWLRKHRRRLAGTADLPADLELDSMDDLPSTEGDPLWPIYEAEWQRLIEAAQERVRRRLPTAYQIYAHSEKSDWPIERVATTFDVTAGYVTKVRSEVKSAIRAELKKLEDGDGWSSKP